MNGLINEKDYIEILSPLEPIFARILYLQTVLLEILIAYFFSNNNLIFSSSCTVYGNPDQLPVTESSPFKKAESPYGETKQMCENILQKSNVNSISLRYFNPIGSHRSGLIGDCSSDKPANLIPIICEVAKGVREKLIINGDDYNTIDGTCVRDYIHVVDLAKSHVSALNYLLKNPTAKKYPKYFFHFFWYKKSDFPSV